MLPNKLREHRERLGLSQTKLACMTGLAGSMISDFEAGKRLAWSRARRAIAEALGVKEIELFGENGGETRG